MAAASSVLEGLFNFAPAFLMTRRIGIFGKVSQLNTPSHYER
jgi:hypothetical protein